MRIYGMLLWGAFFLLGQIGSLCAAENASPKNQIELPDAFKEQPIKVDLTETDKNKDAKKELSDAQKIKRMVRHILGRPHWSDRFLSLLDRDIPKIAVHPFKTEELPISLKEAQVFEDAFTRELIAQAAKRYAVVGRKELKALITDINEMGSANASVNPLGTLMDRAQADLLVIGTLGVKGEKFVLSYKLVENETGRIVSAAQESFKRPAKAENIDNDLLSLEGAAQKAVKALMRDISTPRKIMIQGLRYQTSGVDTSFSRYFVGVLANVLREKAKAGARNFNDLQVGDFVVEEERFRGLKLVSGSVENNELQGRQGRDYILKGTYWPFENKIELRLELVAQNGTLASWRGWISIDTIAPELDLVPPPAPIEAQDAQALGPFDLYLSSNKGSNPSFKLGEKMILAVKTGQDAYLSCYYLQADNTIFRIFPNRFVPDSKVNGGFLQQIPSAAMPFSFEFSPPSGVEAVKCFALDRDPLNDPAFGKIKQAAFEPLPFSNERELTGFYRSLSNVALSEASLIVSVHGE